MPAMRKHSVNAGPECSLATVPTRTYTPAPNVDPTPASKDEETKQNETPHISQKVFIFQTRLFWGSGDEIFFL